MLSHQPPLCPVPGTPGEGAGRGALTSGQAWEGAEPVQVLGHLLPQVFEGAETRGERRDEEGRLRCPRRRGPWGSGAGTTTGRGPTAQRVGAGVPARGVGTE